MRNEVSEVGHRILLLINTKENEGLSFNELRGPPYNFNPKTLAHQLRRLHSWRLISRHGRAVRGGKQYRYKLTPKGERYLLYPLSLQDLDMILFHTLIRVLGSDSKTKNQLLGIDLATQEGINYRVELSVRLAWDNETCKVGLEWDRGGQTPVHLNSVEITA